MDNTTEHRVTLGAYERKLAENAQLVGLVKGLGLPLGIAGLGVGLVLAAMALGGLLAGWLEGLKDLFNGADSEKRQEVNSALDDDPADAQYTPEQWQGMSVSSIYSLVYDGCADIRGKLYDLWLGDAPDNSTNYTYFMANHNINFGPAKKRISNMKVATGQPAAGSDGEVDYSGFAWQITIRETAARRYLVWSQGNIATNWLQNVFGSMSDLEWQSRNVSEAPQYNPDALLWAAWGRTSWQSVTGAAGLSLGYKASQYASDVTAGFIFEEEAWAFYQAMQNGQIADDAWPAEWYPPNPPVSS